MLELSYAAYNKLVSKSKYDRAGKWRLALANGKGAENGVGLKWYTHRSPLRSKGKLVELHAQDFKATKGFFLPIFETERSFKGINKQLELVN